MKLYHAVNVLSIVLYCIVLYCIVLYCIVLYCIVLYCIVLYCITKTSTNTMYKIEQKFVFNEALNDAQVL